ncbi:MAG: hypothetical protein Q8920_08620 [Bacillota bacterium]|nr:hypothetical protein [Bacillota bacterium]
MKIRYVCISNDEVRKEMARGHIVRVGLSQVPSEIWQKYFFFKCRRGTSIRKNSIKIMGDELRLIIEREKNIQDYIETIKTVIGETNENANRATQRAVTLI